MQCAHISLSICYIKHILLGIIHTCYLFVSVVYLPPHFEPPLDCSELPMQCFSARLMVVTLLRQCQHRLLFANVLNLQLNPKYRTRGCNYGLRPSY